MTNAGGAGSLQRAYFVWASALAAAIGALLLFSAEPTVRQGLMETAGSFLTPKVMAIILAALVCEYIDSTLGMGYGTTLTPILMLVGYEPLKIIPAVLLSELLTGLTSGALHHGAGNVDLGRRSRHRRIVLLLGGCSVVGAAAAAVLAITIARWVLSLYIGLLVLGIGVVILATMNRSFSFSWAKITGLGLVAAFNKGMSGGGYGPLVMGGQLLSGLDARSAVGITSVAEGLTCLVGVVLYTATTGIDSHLALPLVLGAMFSVPLSVHSVRALSARRLRLGIGLLTIALGAATLVKLVW
jgi:uncharacterized membrane protein YfcA